MNCFQTLFQLLKLKYDELLSNFGGFNLDVCPPTHGTRNVRPHLFISAFTNKILYGLFGARDIVEHSCAGMARYHPIPSPSTFTSLV